MGIFLTAEWRHLVMLNYELAPAVLYPLVPDGTELDTWNGRACISVVGFLFQNTRVFGIPVPGHVNFEEVNLRFYVRRHGPEGWRRGVVFVKELVPRRAIAAVARMLYNENYRALPMRHRVVGDVEPGNGDVDRPLRIDYEWKRHGRWQGLHAATNSSLRSTDPGSEAEFITEHYWGYVTQRDGGTVEYQVSHPRWQIQPIDDASLDCDVADLYGPQFIEPLQQRPTSGFIADGSAVAVHRGTRIA